VYDLLSGIHEMGLKDVTESDLLLVYNRFDNDKDGTLRFSEFSNAFTPL
jgi:hypothetical protein